MNDGTTQERRPPLNRAEREARKAFRQAEAVKALSEHDKAQRAFHQNRERLKAERLAREAQTETAGEQGIVLDEKAQEQPKDKKRAQKA